MQTRANLTTIILSNASDNQFSQTEPDSLSIIQQTLRQCSNFCPLSKIILVAPNEKQNKLMQNVYSLGMNLHSNNLLLEPSSYASATSIMLAMIHANETIKGDSHILIMPSYYNFIDRSKIEKALNSALNYLEPNSVITFGMENITTPNNHVYLIPDADTAGTSQIQKCKKFITDFPDEELLCKRFYLDSGIYLTSSDFLLQKFTKYYPQMYKLVYNAYKNAHRYLDRLFINYVDYQEIPIFPVSSLLLNNNTDIAIAPLEAGWIAMEDLDLIYVDSCENNNNLNEDEDASFKYQSYCQLYLQ